MLMMSVSFCEILLSKVFIILYIFRTIMTIIDNCEIYWYKCTRYVKCCIAKLDKYQDMVWFKKFFLSNSFSYKRNNEMKKQNISTLFKCKMNIKAFVSNKAEQKNQRYLNAE